MLTHKNLRGQTYVAENKSDHDKTLLIEHPRYGGGWELVDTAAPLEKTDAVYRFKEVVPANKSAKLVVNEQVTTDQTLAILPTDAGSLEFFHQSGKIPKDVQDALAKAIVLKNAMTDTERQIAEARQTLNDIDAEQGRIRNNLNTITKSGAYVHPADDQAGTTRRRRSKRRVARSMS